MIYSESVPSFELMIIGYVGLYSPTADPISNQRLILFLAKFDYFYSAKTVITAYLLEAVPIKSNQQTYIAHALITTKELAIRRFDASSLFLGHANPLNKTT